MLLIPTAQVTLAHSLASFLKKSFAIVAILYRSLTIFLLQDLLPLELRFQPAAPPNLLKNIQSNTGRASVVKNDIVSN